MGSDPRAARTPAEYVAALRALRDEAGLSYRQLERRAHGVGDVLPRATVAGALARTALPRAELVTAFVRACGGDAAAVCAWLDARERLAASVRATATDPPRTEEPGPRTEESGPRTEGADPRRERKPTGPPETVTGHPVPPDPAPPPARSGASRAGAAEAGSAAPARGAEPPPEPVARHGRWRPAIARRPLRSLVPVSFGAGVGAALALWLALWLQSPSGDGQGAVPPPEPSGWVTMRPVDAPRLCVTEGRERNRRTDRPVAVQLPCERAPRPRVFLEHVSGSIYRVQWHHPVHDKGCLSVDEPPHGAGEGEELVSPRECTGQPHQRFRLEPVGRGYRLRPLDSGLCLGLLPPRTEGAELAQALCTGYEDQSFRFERARPTAPHSPSPRSAPAPSANPQHHAAPWA
ncbi:RICIN domain-containing protein [Streptomyces buecherae]|uniref:RICIN domain-containing protein n=1 Tax=Streptomyces buecherae TaxID=2763006 RepID=A0A7H8N9E1_9ACTN|nr:RICIN domain-containing protein [Streptomyces buecherae]QKW51084.1 RICIN domain-containing protein [Streptomyces buecherae]